MATWTPDDVIDGAQLARKTMAHIRDLEGAEYEFAGDAPVGALGSGAYSGDFSSLATGPIPRRPHPDPNIRRKLVGEAIDDIVVVPEMRGLVKDSRNMRLSKYVLPALRAACAAAADDGYVIRLVSAYRDYAAQVRCKRAKGGWAAAAGNSPHHTGGAIDAALMRGGRLVERIPTLEQYLYAAGFTRHLVFRSKDGALRDEPWHYEFGTDRWANERADVMKSLVAQAPPAQPASGGHDALLQRYFGTNARVAKAVMMQESSGNPRSTNASTGCYGLFQIRLSAHYKKIPGATDAEKIAALYDPETNIKLATLISGAGKNWTPWEAYTSGAYLKWLDR